MIPVGTEGRTFLETAIRRISGAMRKSRFSKTPFVSLRRNISSPISSKKRGRRK